MKTMNAISYIKRIGVIPVVAAGLILVGCKKDEEDPHHEHDHEVFTDVKLIFTNTEDSEDIVEATAQDSDGEGVDILQVKNAINLDTSKSYTLTFEIMNNLETPGENIGAEIKEEDDEHQVFFSFSEGAFSNPSGNGNIDKASDPIVYNDKDENGFPVGLNTSWETSSTPLEKGTFTVQLQHQPGVKTATSSVEDGDADFVLRFELNIN
tara:strand:- start:1955 stop:2581 length:627 start_codon:yes stop_codon:yes gene_type:complete